MKEIRVTLPCECGASVIAEPHHAGSSIACRCGRSVSVPRLSELRTLAGQDAFVTNPAEAIAKLQRTGVSPAGNDCLLCGSHSPTLYRCDATCESSHIKGGGEKKFNTVLSWLAFMSLAFFAGLAFLRQSQSTQLEVRGHDLGVTFDLPVCDACASTNGNPTRPAVAKKLMQCVPAYFKLLDEYPSLTLKINRAA